MKTITYLRAGRTKRGSGEIIETHPKTGMFKVLPGHAGWKPIWITVKELQSGGSAVAAQPPHLAAVARMVDGLRELLERKEDAA
jgi:hypothetical protein